MLKEIRYNSRLWLLAFVPVLFAAERLKPEAHTLLFVLSILAIVPLAALLSHATESVAAKTGDTVGGLLNNGDGRDRRMIVRERYAFISLPPERFSKNREAACCEQPCVSAT